MKYNRSDKGLNRDAKNKKRKVEALRVNREHFKALEISKNSKQEVEAPPSFPLQVPEVEMSDLIRS